MNNALALTAILSGCEDDFYSLPTEAQEQIIQLEKEFIHTAASIAEPRQSLSAPGYCDDEYLKEQGRYESSECNNYIEYDEKGIEDGILDKIESTRSSIINAAGCVDNSIWTASYGTTGATFIYVNRGFYSEDVSVEVRTFVDCD